MTPRKQRNKTDLYYRKDAGSILNIRSIPAALTALAGALNKVKRGTNLLLPGQHQMTQESLVATLCFWVEDLVNKKGLSGFEAELREAFEINKKEVAADMQLYPPNVGGKSEGTEGKENPPSGGVDSGTGDKGGIGKQPPGISLPKKSKSPGHRGRARTGS